MHLPVSSVLPAHPSATGSARIARRALTGRWLGGLGRRHLILRQMSGVSGAQGRSWRGRRRARIANRGFRCGRKEAHASALYRARRARAAHCEIGWRRYAPFRACGAEKASMEPISMAARENIVDLGGLPRRRRRPERLPKTPVA